MNTIVPPAAPAAAPETFVFPVSFAQQRLWILDRLEPGGAVYNVPAALRLQGPLHRDALVGALNEIVRRHEALRTVFRVLDGEPVQVVSSHAEAAVEETDLSHLPFQEREEELARLSNDEVQKPFSLARGPLFRTHLVRMADDDHALLMTMHHIVSDGWSVAVLNRELGALYEAFAQGRPSPLEEIPIQYADYAVWQREHLGDEELNRQTAYWKEALTGAPALLDLPTDHPRPAVQRHHGRSLSGPVPQEVTDALKAVARAEGCTLFMVTLAVFDVLMQRLSGQDDIVLGTPLAGRTRQEVEGLIGFFVNTLVLRSDLSGDPSFRELLGRVRQSVLGAHGHQDVPFEKLVDELKVERSVSHSPLFQVMFTLQNTPGLVEGPPLAGLRIAGIPAETDAEKYDMTVTLTEVGDMLWCDFRYETDLFEEATVRRMMRAFLRLLGSAAADPSLPLSALSLLSPEDRAEALRLGESPLQAVERGDTIHALFERQAAEKPDATALIHRDETLTYGDLNAGANRLARHLRALGVGPETTVAICLDRTPDLVVAIFATLKAGGAYIPVDPAYPAGRIALMVEDGRAAVLLSHSSLAEHLPETAARTLLVDSEAGEIGAYPSTDLDPMATAENAAYAIFTSGSTGRPKGVQIEHRSTVAVLHQLREMFSDAERSRVLGSTSASFDVSVAEIHHALCWGGTLVLVENAMAAADLPADAGVTFAAMVPSAAAELLRIGGVPASLKTIVLGGEAVPTAVSDGLYALGTIERVVNGYGPTEDTTYSTMWEIPRGAERMRIGRPVAGSRAHVLDARMRPAPVGVPGELFMAGAGVARGYLHRPGLTAERFVPDPNGAPGSRMYRVGDRVRMLADGELEYFGRLDFQVKVRGYRIEIGEIEAGLLRHPDVADAVVVVREDTPGDHRIVAYVRPRGEAPAADALRSLLQGLLPAYMIPSAYVVLDDYPRTPNGKVDRRALPKPDAAAGAEAAQYVPPRDELEETIAAIWREVLGVDRVGVNDSFFDLGGHSLLLTQVHGKVRERVASDVPLMVLFRFPTVRALAEHLGSASREEASADRGRERAEARRALRTRRRETRGGRDDD